MPPERPLFPLGVTILGEMSDARRAAIRKRRLAILALREPHPDCPLCATRPGAHVGLHRRLEKARK